MGQLELFDYGALAPPLARSLQERAERITRRERRVVEDILANGKEFAEAREELRRCKDGGFEGWYTYHGWKRGTVYNYLQVWEQFGDLPNLGSLAIDPSALYLLAAPSTPEAAREEALARAEAGEPVSYSAAQEIVAGAKEAEAEEEAGGPTQQELWGEGEGFASHLDGCDPPAVVAVEEEAPAIGEEELAELERLCAEADPAPWKVDVAEDEGDPDAAVWPECWGGGYLIHIERKEFPEACDWEAFKADCRFIARAREAVPALVAEVRRLWAILAREGA
jgi:hypothetical protein